MVDASAHTNYLFSELLKSAGNPPAESQADRQLYAECRLRARGPEKKIHAALEVGRRATEPGRYSTRANLRFACRPGKRESLPASISRRPVLDARAVDADGALLDHPEGLAVTGDQLRLAQQVGDA